MPGDTKPKYLIIPKQELDLDSLCASFALALALHASEANVAIYLTSKLYSQELQVKFPLGELELIEEHTTNSLIISLAKPATDVKNITWKEEDGKLKITIATDSDQLNEQSLEVNKDGVYGRKIILVGLDDPAALGEFYLNNKSAFAHSEPEIVTRGTLTSTCEAALAHIMTNTLELSQEVASYLLAGIFWGTNSFRHLVSVDTFRNCALLLENGANITHARAKTVNTVSLLETKYYAGCYQNLRIVDNHVFYAVIPYATAKLLQVDNFKSADLVPISQIEGCKVAFVIIEGKHVNTVFIRSSVYSLNLQDLLAEYEGKGDNLGGKFYSATKANELAGELTNRIKQLFAQMKKNKKHAKKQMPAPSVENVKTEPEPVVKPKVEPVSDSELEKKEVDETDVLATTGETTAPIADPAEEDQKWYEKIFTGKFFTEEVPVETNVEVEDATAAKEAEPVQADPLAPATQIPQPMRFGTTKKEEPSSPLPPAN